MRRADIIMANSRKIQQNLECFQTSEQKSTQKENKAYYGHGKHRRQKSNQQSPEIVHIAPHCKRPLMDAGCSNIQDDTTDAAARTVAAFTSNNRMSSPVNKEQLPLVDDEQCGQLLSDISGLFSATEMDDIDDSFCGNLSGIVELVTASIQPPDQSSGLVNQSVDPVGAVQSPAVGSLELPAAGLVNQSVEPVASVQSPAVGSVELPAAGLVNQSVDPVGSVPEQSAGLASGLEQTVRKKASNGKADSRKWFRNQNKLQRLRGEGYCSSLRNDDFEERPPRLLGSRCLSKRCSRTRSCNKLSEEDRQRIHFCFWQSMDWDQRKVFVASMVDEIEINQKRKTKRTDEKQPRKQCTFRYYLKKGDDRLQVCKTMFLSTLCIGEWSLRNWMKHAQDGMVRTRKDQPLPQMNRSSGELREEIRKFLTDLPKLPSHYCRASSSKLYLEPCFQSISEVYRVFTGTQARPVASRQVFAEEFEKMSIGLFMPKKDQCDKCCAYIAGNVSETDYLDHIKRKEDAKVTKEADKERALGEECNVVTMDVQAVQLVPYLQASALYFRQKLAVHNFTLYNLVTHEAVCYVWHEGEGELNANVFSSCVVHYVTSELGCSKDIVIYSDGCGSQNRNVTLSNALSMVAREKGITVTHNYLEKGHTQMECDSVHSVIERKKKHREICTPAQYVQLIQEARPTSPYKVHYVNHDFFKDFSEVRVYTSIRPGRKAGDPTVTDLRCLKYLPTGEIHWKLQYTDDWQQHLPSRRATSATSAGISWNLDQLKPLYHSSLKIKPDKFKDLQFLKQVLLSDFHSFYDNLSH